MVSFEQIITVINEKLGQDIRDYEIFQDIEVVVGGQSVASIIDHLVNGTKLVINDIDVFFEEDVKESVIPSRFAYQEFISPVYSSSYHCIETKYSAGYFVSSSVRDGDYNLVGISAGSNVRTKVNLTKLVVDGFDINCCGAGINLKTEEVYLNDHYKEFLKSRKLFFTGLSTPVNSLVRILKKFKSIENVALDINEAITAVKISTCIFQNASYFFNSEKEPFFEIFGPVKKERFDEFKDLLKDHFIWSCDYDIERPYPIVVNLSDEELELAEKCRRGKGILKRGKLRGRKRDYSFSCDDDDCISRLLHFHQEKYYSNLPNQKIHCP